MNVFKMALTGLVILLFSSSSFAQESEPKKMKYGIGMGLNYSKYDISLEGLEPEDNFEPMIGFSLLCSAERTLSDRFKATARPEIAFLGSNVKDLDIKYTNVNVLLPISLHGRIVDQFYFNGGVGIEYLAGISVENAEDSETLEDFIDNRWLPSLHAGISYVVSDWVDIGVKYNYGLGAIQKYDVIDIEGNPSGTLNYKNSYFQFSAIIRQ